MLKKVNHLTGLLLLSSLASTGLNMPAFAQELSSSPIPILEEITTEGELASEPVIVPTSVNVNSIFSPVGWQINSGGPGFGSVNDTINQSGLFVPFISGVTDFDSYIATNPEHTWVFTDGSQDFEWFSNVNTTSASVTYDLGSPIVINRLALWNEESSGIGTLNLFQSLDGINFSPLALGLNPTNNPAGMFNYPADVFNLTPANTRYVRFDMSDCPQLPSAFTACAIGEVAFRAASGSPIPSTPEPSTLVGLLLLSGLAITQRGKDELPRLKGGRGF